MTPRTATFRLALAAILFAPLSARAETQVRVTRLPDKSYEISGTFAVPASLDTVWGVLTDYEGIPSFVSSMRSSRVKESRPDGTVLVEQKAVGDTLFLSKTLRILLEVKRGPDSLRFTDVGGQDFRLYDGSWEAKATASGADVSYRLLAQPRFPAPAFIVGRAMRGGARGLLEQVRAEILRRESIRTPIPSVSTVVSR